jgi:hypothetical protein
MGKRMVRLRRFTRSQFCSSWNSSPTTGFLLGGRRVEPAYDPVRFQAVLAAVGLGGPQTRPPAQQRHVHATPEPPGTSQNGPLLAKAQFQYTNQPSLSSFGSASRDLDIRTVAVCYLDSGVENMEHNAACIFRVRGLGSFNIRTSGDHEMRQAVDND